MAPLSTHHEFSALDNVMPPFYYSFLLCFSIDTTASDVVASCVASLGVALRQLTDEAPYLAGEIRFGGGVGEGRPGQLTLDIPDPLEPLQIIVNDLTKTGSTSQETFQQLERDQFPPERLRAEDFSWASAGVRPTQRPFTVQTNIIPGGIILALQYHHKVCDGKGASLIAARLAELCKGDFECQADSGVEFSRPQHTLGEKPTRQKLPCIISMTGHELSPTFSELALNPLLWKLNSLHPEQTSPDYYSFEWPEYLPSLFPQDPPMIPTVFSFTPTSLVELKKLAQPESSSDDDWVSTSDALAALLWRHIMRARFPKEWSQTLAGNCPDAVPFAGYETYEQGVTRSFANADTSSAVVALNARSALSVPDTHLGNVVFHVPTGLPMSDVLSNTSPLSTLAKTIRQSLTRIQSAPDLLQDAAALAARLPSTSHLRYCYDFLGRDVYVTSWLRDAWYELDFGGPLRTPQWLRNPHGHFANLNCVMPPRPGTGIVDVVVSMAGEEAAERLRDDKEWTRWAIQVSPVPKA